MWRFMREKRDEFAKPFANDLISATGKLPIQAEFIRYHISSEFDGWIQQIFHEWRKLSPTYDFKLLPIIYGVTDSVTESLLPALTMIAPSRDASGRDYPFAVRRVLAHPLAQEFRSIIPWFYRDTEEAFVQLVSQSFDNILLPEVLLQIENLKIFNSRLMRKSVLEAIVYQLQGISFEMFWNALQLSCSKQAFITQTTDYLKKFKTGKYRGIRLPLPNTKKLLYSGIVFWMQLLESIVRDKFNHWQLYWHEKTTHHPASLVFYRGIMPANEFTGLWQPEYLSKEIADTFQVSHDIKEDITVTDSLSLMKFLSCWSHTLNHD